MTEHNSFKGAASFYPAFMAKFPPNMVTGEPYNPNDFTIAIDDERFEIGDVVSVSYVSQSGNTRAVRCRVTDVPWHPEVPVGLSWRAYRMLEHPGLHPIQVEVRKV